MQPYAHLSSGRVSSGTLVLSPCLESVVDDDGANANAAGAKKGANERSVRQVLLTTCVGSTDELEEMVLIAGNVFQKVSFIHLQTNKIELFFGNFLFIGLERFLLSGVFLLYLLPEPSSSHVQRQRGRRGGVQDQPAVEPGGHPGVVSLHEVLAAGVRGARRKVADTGTIGI